MGNSHSISSNHKGDIEKISKKILSDAPVSEIITLIEKELGDHARLVPGYVNDEKYAQWHLLHVAVKHKAPMELIKYLTKGASRFGPIIALKRTKEINENDTLDWLTSSTSPDENNVELLKILLPRIPIEVTMHYYSQLFINLLTCPVEITPHSNRQIEVFLNHVHAGMVQHPKSRPGPNTPFYIPFEFDFLQYPNLRYFVGFQFVTPYQYICDPHFSRTDTPELRSLISILHRNWMGWNPLYHVFIENLIQQRFTEVHFAKRLWTSGLGIKDSSNYRVTGVFHHWFLPPQPISSVTIEHNSWSELTYVPEVVEYAMVANWDLTARDAEFKNFKNATKENIQYSLFKFFPRDTFHSHSDLTHGFVRADGSIRTMPYSLFGPDLPAGVLFNNNKLFNSQLFNWLLEDLATLHHQQYLNGTYIYYPWQSVVTQWVTTQPVRDYDSPIWVRMSHKYEQFAKFLPSVTGPLNFLHLCQFNPDETHPYTLHIANPHTTDVDWTSIYYKHFEEADKKVDEHNKGKYWINAMPRQGYFLHEMVPPEAFGQYIHEMFLYSHHPRPPNPPGPREVVQEGVKLLKFSDFQEEIRQIFISLIPSPVIPQLPTFFQDLYKTPIHIRNAQLQLLRNEPFHYAKTLPQRWSSPYYLDLTKTLRFLTLFKQRPGYPASSQQLLTSVKSYLNTAMKPPQSTGDQTRSIKDKFFTIQNTFSILPKQQYTTYSLRYISRALYLLQQPNVPLYADSQLAANVPKTPGTTARSFSSRGYFSDPDPINNVAYHSSIRTGVRNWESLWPVECLPIELPFFKDQNDSKEPDYALFGVLHKLFPFTTQPVIPMVSVLTQICNDPNLLLTSMKTVEFIEEFYNKMVSSTTTSSTEMNLTAYEDPVNMIGGNGKYSIPILAYLTRADFAIAVRYLQHGFGHDIHLSDHQISKWNNTAYNLTSNAIQGSYPRGTTSNYGMDINPTISGIAQTSNKMYSQEPPQTPNLTNPLPLIYNPALMTRLALLPQTIPSQLSMERSLLNAKFPMTDSSLVYEPWVGHMRSVTPKHTLSGLSFQGDPRDYTARRWALAHLTSKSLQGQMRYDPIVYQPSTLPLLDILHPKMNKNVNYFNEELLRFPSLLSRLWSSYDSSASFFNLSILQELNFQMYLGRKVPTFRPGLYTSDKTNTLEQVCEIASSHLNGEVASSHVGANFDPLNVFAVQAIVGGVGAPYEGSNVDWEEGVAGLSNNTNNNVEVSKSKSKVSKNSKNSKNSTPLDTQGPSSEEILRQSLQPNNPLCDFDARLSTEWLDRIGSGYKVLTLSKLLMRSGMATNYTLTKPLPTMGHINHIGDVDNAPPLAALSRRQNMLPVVDNHGLVAHCNPFGLPYYSSFLIHSIDYNPSLLDPDTALNIPRLQPAGYDFVLPVDKSYAVWWNSEHEIYPIEMASKLTGIEKNTPSLIAQPSPLPITDYYEDMVLYHQPQPLGVLMKAFIHSLHLFPSVDEIMKKGGALGGFDYNNINSFTQWAHCQNYYGFETAPKPLDTEYNAVNTPQSGVSRLNPSNSAQNGNTPSSVTNSLHNPINGNNNGATTPLSSTTTLQLPLDLFPFSDLPDNDDTSTPRRGTVSLCGIESKYTLQDDDEGQKETTFGTKVLPSLPAGSKLPLIDIPPLDFILSSFHDQFMFLMGTGTFWVNFQSPFFPLWNQMEILTLPAHSKSDTNPSTTFSYDDLLSSHQRRILNTYHFFSEVLLAYHQKVENLLDLPQLLMLSPDKAPKTAEIDFSDLIVTLPRHIASSRVLPPPQSLPESILRSMQGYFFQVPRMVHNSFGLNLVGALFDVAEAFIIKHTLKQEDTHEYYRVATVAHQAASRPPMAIPAGMNRKHAKIYKTKMVAELDGNNKKDKKTVPSDSDSASDTDDDDDASTPSSSTIASSSPLSSSIISSSDSKSGKNNNGENNGENTNNSGETEGIDAPSEHHSSRPFNHDEIPILTTSDYAEYYITFLLFQPYAFDDNVMISPDRQVQSITRIKNQNGAKQLGFIPKIDPKMVYATDPVSTKGIGGKVRYDLNKLAQSREEAEIDAYNNTQREANLHEDVLIATNYHFLYNLFNTNELERLEYRSQFHNLSFDQFVTKLAQLQAKTSSAIRLSIEQSSNLELIDLESSAQHLMETTPMSYEEAVVEVDTAMVKSLLEKKVGPEKLPVRATHFPSIRDCINVIDSYITTVVYKLFPHIAAHPQFALPQKGLLWFMDLVYQPSLDDILPLIKGLTVDPSELPPTASTLFTTSCDGVPFAYDYPFVERPILLKPFVVVSVEEVDNVNKEEGLSEVVLIDPILSLFEPVDMLYTSSLVLHPTLANVKRPDVPQPVLEQPITYGQTFFIQSILRRSSPDILNALLNTLTMDAILAYRNHHMVTPYVQEKHANKFSVFDFMEIARTFTYAPGIVQKMERAAKDFYL